MRLRCHIIADYFDALPLFIFSFTIDTPPALRHYYAIDALFICRDYYFFRYRFSPYYAYAPATLRCYAMIICRYALP